MQKSLWPGRGSALFVRAGPVLWPGFRVELDIMRGRVRRKPGLVLFTPCLAIFLNVELTATLLLYATTPATIS